MDTTARLWDVETGKEVSTLQVAVFTLVLPILQIVLSFKVSLLVMCIFCYFATLLLVFLKIFFA